MDATTKIQIDRNIPQPKPNCRNGLSKYPWNSMAVGDSFLFPAGVSKSSAYSNCDSAKKRTGFKFSIRVTDEGIRCWRTA